MSDPDELRELRAKAYGPEGTLTDAEAARLTELQRPRLEPGEPVAPVETLVPEHADSQGDAEPPEDAGPSAGVRGPSRRRLLPAVIGAIALLVGGGAGWSLAQRPIQDPAIELSAQQQAWEESITATGDYDAGSLRVVGELDGVVAWSATKDDGAQLCAVIADGPDSSRLDCALRKNALAGEVMYTQLIHDTDAEAVVISVTGLATTGAEVAASMHRHAMPTADSAGFSGAEEAADAETLVTRGYVPESIQVAARNGGDVAWVARRADDTVCLILRVASEADRLDTSCLGPDSSSESIAFDLVDFASGEGRQVALTILPGDVPHVEFEEESGFRPGP